MSQSQPQSKVVVGITSRSPETNLVWLKNFLSETFPNDITKVIYLPITNSNRNQWERDVKQCAVVILYHTKRQGRINIADVDGALYDEELQYLHQTLGKVGVLVVVDDMQNCGEEEKQRILQTQPSLAQMSRQLILFPEYNKHDAASKNKSDFHKLLNKGDVRRFLLVNRPHYMWYSSFPCKVSRKICIFSRAAEGNYTWLLSGLKAELGMESDIKCVHITNDYGAFKEEVERCGFAILYHTLKHGRINIADVSGSLYDEELKHLSENLGKEKVIVVADDLNGDGDREKSQILERQPSIARLARELFVFAEREKNPARIREIAQMLRRR